MKRNFPSFIQAFLEYSKNVGAPHKFLLWSAISGISAALERKTWLRSNKKYIYPNQFIFLIAESGTGKSTAIRPISEILKKMKTIAETSTQFSAAALVAQMREAGEVKTFDHMGVKYKNSSMLCISDEISVTIGEKNGLDGVQMLLTNLYDCGVIGAWSDLPGWTKNTIGGGDSEIFNPCINLLAGSTPSSLISVLGKNGIAGGFASRALFVSGERQARDKGWIDDDEAEDLQTQKLLIEDLKRINSLKGAFRVDETWKQVYGKYEMEFDKKVVKGSQMAPYFERKLTHCTKLAQVLAADQSDYLILTGEHLEQAKRLIDDIEPDMYSTFPISGENRHMPAMTYVWDVMRKKSRWSRAEIQSRVLKNAGSSQLSEFLRTLMDMKRIKFDNTGSAGGAFYDVIDNSPLEKL